MYCNYMRMIVDLDARSVDLWFKRDRKAVAKNSTCLFLFWRFCFYIFFEGCLSLLCLDQRGLPGQV